MRALSLRLKLTLVFATAMAAVLAAMGLFIYLRVGGALASTVDRNLSLQAAETIGHLEGGGGPLIDPDADGGRMVAELLDAEGNVIRASPGALPALLKPDDAARIAAGGRLLRQAHIPGRGHDWRVLAVPVQLDGQPAALVLAGSLGEQHEALHHLLVEFLIAGPIALLLASLAGYALAAGALRPVESMRRRAAAISASTPGRRLPVPPGHDEIARLATTLNEMLGRLEDAFEHERAAIEHERRFIADASHELRTPLALLHTELELALRRPRPRVELEAALRSAAEESERLTRLAADLLLIARSDQGRLPVRCEATPVHTLFESAIDRCASRVDEQGRTIETEDTDGLVVDADPAYIEQALRNLIENAVTYAGGTIVLSAVVRDELVELHVMDSGEGMPAEFVPRAFDRFSRADEARGRGGTGLGLAIVDLIAEAHGGSAGAARRPEGGTDVWIAVRRAESSAPEDAQVDLQRGLEAQPSP